MFLDNWAQTWNVPSEALRELKLQLGLINDGIAPTQPGLSEAGVQSQVRLEASRKGLRLWRNNVGAYHTPDGSFVRYGLGNDSIGVNLTIKSADLIGIRPVIIEPWMIGITIGQFVSREIKHSGWRYTGNAREKAQMQWATLILGMGGDACFATGEGTL